MASASILVGTAGWGYPDWENLVYPPGKTAGRLRLVARYLDCVEVDSSFYRPPTTRATENWVRAVEDLPRFRFLAKAWQRFTHERSSPWTTAEFELFTGRVGAPARERAAQFVAVPVPVVVSGTTRGTATGCEPSPTILRTGRCRSRCGTTHGWRRRHSSFYRSDGSHSAISINPCWPIASRRPTM